jgi:hypothetical protein
MRVVKCRAAAAVIDVLQRRKVEALYISSLALDPWLPWGTKNSDDLQVLIPHDQLDPFMAAMNRGGYVLAFPKGGKCVPANAGQAKTAKSSILSMPASPEASYVHKSCIGRQPDLWITFHTTKRHGRLMLVDLTEWLQYKYKRQAQVMKGTKFARTVYLPPLWAMLLWQAAEVTCAASECAITRYDVKKLSVITGHLAAGDWPLVLNKAQQYDAEYRRRLSCAAATQLMQRYQQVLGISPGDLRTAEFQYGALHELSHALKAVTDYGGTVDPNVWAFLGSVTTQQPRNLWAYPGVVRADSVPDPGSAGGRLGIARADFGIHEQIEHYSGADFDYLLDHGLIERLLIPAGRGTTAPPHGPWASCTQADLNAIIP